MLLAQNTGDVMKLKPLFWLTVVTLPALVTLLWLGTWQLQRLEWKNNLISSFEARSAAPAIELPAASDVTAEMEFRRLALTGEFDHAN